MTVLNVRLQLPSNLEPAKAALTFIGCAVLTLLVREFRSWWQLRHVPGNFWNSISILPLSHLAGGGKISFVLKDMQKRYGPLMRIGPNLVMFGDADTYRSINSVRSEFVKGPWYTPARVSPLEDNLFSMLGEALRKELKAKIAPAYAARDGIGFEPKVDRIVGELVDLLERKYISTPTEYRPANFAHIIQFFTLDVISELGWGEAIGFLANDKDMYRYVEINEQTFPIISVLLTAPWLDKYLKAWPLNMALPKEGDKVGFGRLISFATNCVNRRLAPGAEDGDDMMQTHIRNGLTEDELKAEVIFELIAGSDSTATAIRVTLLCLMNTPSAWNNLRREIDLGVAAGRISSPICDSEAYGLPYLQATIKEGLRLYPPSTGMNNKEVPKGGAHIHGYYLPEGTQVAVNIVHMLRDQKLFGPDADIFRPERWIEAAAVDEVRFNEMNEAVELAFGYGKYQCLGKSIAYMELNKVFIELLRRYDLAAVNPHKPMVLFDAAFWLVHDFHVRATRREQ